MKAHSAPAPFSTTPARLDLTRFRKKAGVKIEEIAEETKISLRFLRAIEAEEFEKLPGGIFTTSYLRQYAAAIGFNEAELLAHYAHRTGQPSTEKSQQDTNGNQGFLYRWLKVPAQAER